MKIKTYRTKTGDGFAVINIKRVVDKEVLESIIYYQVYSWGNGEKGITRKAVEGWIRSTLTEYSEDRFYSEHNQQIHYDQKDYGDPEMFRRLGFVEKTAKTLFPEFYKDYRKA